MGKARCLPRLGLSQPPPQQLEPQCQQPCPPLLCHRLLSFKCLAHTQQPQRLPSWGSRAESFGNLSLMSSVIKVLIRQVGLPHRVLSLGGERGGEFRWPITSASARFTFTAGDGDGEGVMWMPLTMPAHGTASRFLPLPFKAALSCPPHSGPSQARPLIYPLTDHSSLLWPHCRGSENV